MLVFLKYGSEDFNLLLIEVCKSAFDDDLSPRLISVIFISSVLPRRLDDTDAKLGGGGGGGIRGSTFGASTISASKNSEFKVPAYSRRSYTIHIISDLYLELRLTLFKSSILL